MGGSKNKSPAQKERAQTAHRQDPKKGGKKGEKQEGAPKAEITVTLTEQQAARAMRAKVITAPDLARQTGVKISAAAAFLRAAAADGRVRLVGGKSGHRIYQPAGAA